MKKLKDFLRAYCIPISLIIVAISIIIASLIIGDCILKAGNWISRSVFIS